VSRRYGVVPHRSPCSPQILLEFAVLKKFGLVAVGATASLLAIAPAASAHEHDSCSPKSDSSGNNGQAGACNVYNHHNGEGNTFNGVEIPGAPALPELPTMIPGLS
jgi:hypothetical protein